MRFRHVFLGLGSLLVMLLVTLTDPSIGFISQLPFGAGLVGLLINLNIAVLFVSFLHIARKGLFDYVDLSGFFSKALESSIGAGIALLAISVAMVAISIMTLAAVK